MTFSTLLAVVLAQGAALSVAMTGAWTVQQKTGNAGWVDVVWTFAVGFVGVVSALAPLGDGGSPSERQLLVAALVAVWAVRLGSHIARRTAGKADDPRYARLIEGWGEQSSWKMLVLMWKQALVSVPLVVAVFAAAHRPGDSLDVMDFVAICIFAAAMIGETISDRQLRAFARSPSSSGRVCTAGLWRYSRHPNYFFEWLHWTAYPIIAFDASGQYPLGWLAVLGPAVMYWLLRHVSGVPPLEEHMVLKHGDAYRAYQRSTSAFFPWVSQHG